MGGIDGNHDDEYPGTTGNGVFVDTNTPPDR
jgi:hypothetical protein